MSRYLVVMAVGIALVSAVDVNAQEPTVTARLGGIVYGTGDDVNCPHGMGVVGELSYFTASRWTVGASVGARLAGPPACSDVLIIADYQGEMVPETSGVAFLFAPDVSVGGGYRIGTASRYWVPRARGGVSVVRTLDSGTTFVLAPHASLDLEIGLERITLFARHGRLRTPVEWGNREGGPYRTFGRWRQLSEAGMQFRIR